jgi:hypothetical protein
MSFCVVGGKLSAQFHHPSHSTDFHSIHRNRHESHAATSRPIGRRLRELLQRFCKHLLQFIPIRLSPILSWYTVQSPCGLQFAWSVKHLIHVLAYRRCFAINRPVVIKILCSTFKGEGSPLSFAAYPGMGAHTRRGLWKVNRRVSAAARQTFVWVVNAASGFLLFCRPVILSPLLEVLLAGKGQISTSRGVCGWAREKRPGEKKKWMI